jgi:hypothetical protein
MARTQKQTTQQQQTVGTGDNLGHPQANRSSSSSNIKSYENNNKRKKKEKKKLRNKKMFGRR